jgi:hypothetical protein
MVLPVPLEATRVGLSKVLGEWEIRLVGPKV